jgi:hypothetical protein
MLIFALAIAAPSALTITHQRDIGCVAILGLLADEQRRNGIDSDFPDVGMKGRTYAGIVGVRIVAETGLPPEIVGQAIITAADDARSLALATMDGKKQVRSRARACLPLMETDLLADVPLPKPAKAK